MKETNSSFKSNSNNSTSKSKKKTKSQNAKKQPTENSEENYNEIYSNIKNNKWNYSIVLFLITVVLLSFYMQYKFELQRRSYRGSEADQEIDYYDVLGLTEGASPSDIKKAYKELAKIWHPDRNPGCGTCADKFKLIAKAEEVLRNKNSENAVSLFKSNPYYLTESNYHKLVEESHDFWLIVVYEGQSGNNFNQYLADSIDEVSEKYKSFIKFGVIDVLKHHDILHFIPYKFQYFPNIFTLQYGESELMGNLDLFSVTTLTQFIEESFINKVNLVDEYAIKNLISDYTIWEVKDTSDDKENAEVNATVNSKEISVNKDITIKNFLDVKVLVLSSKSYIDLITKDQAKFYENEISVYQNDIGFFNSVSYSIFNYILI